MIKLFDAVASMCVIVLTLSALALWVISISNYKYSVTYTTELEFASCSV